MIIQIENSQVVYAFGTSYRVVGIDENGAALVLPAETAIVFQLQDAWKLAVDRIHAADDSRDSDRRDSCPGSGQDGRPAVD